MQTIDSADRRKFIQNTVFALIGGAILFGAPAYSRGNAMSGGCMNNLDITQTNFTPLNAKQKEELLYLYQEEKVARDVYEAMNKLYPNEMTFSNIRYSEQRHMDMVKMLCKRYKVDISKVKEDEYGKFILPELQKLHNTLVSRGEKNLNEALKVGELIEVTDIADIDKMLPDFKDYPDVTMVIERLRNGSNNHLSAFRRSISIYS